MKQNKPLLSREERNNSITRALNQGMVRNKKKEMELQQERQMHSKKEKLILTNSKDSKERQQQIKKISDDITRALKEGIRESNNKKNKQLPSWDKRKILLSEALSKGIERNTQKQKNKVSVDSVKNNPSLSNDRMSKELIDEIFGKVD